MSYVRDAEHGWWACGECGIQNAPDVSECLCGTKMADPRKLMTEKEANALDGLLQEPPD